MTTALGIASVSVVLVDLLNNGLIDDDVGSVVGGNVAVSALPPDRILTNGSAEKTQLNLFLYLTTPNIGWRNADLPSRNARGERLTNPPLALNLHYLLSAYGEKDYHAEILLGHAMQILHEHPILGRAEIRKALTAPGPTTTTSALPPALRELATSELAEQVELIKVTQEPLSTEEMSKLWTAFQTHYRSTAAYEATVVLIQSRRPTRSPLPVRGRRVYVEPLRRPTIESIRPASGEGPILVDSTIVLSGRDLAGEETLVRLGGEEAVPDPDDVAPTRIELSLTGIDLRAGVVGAQIVHRVRMGDPPLPHRGPESNLAAFVLRPTIASPPAKTLTTDAAGLHNGTITVGIDPHVQAGQRAVLLLNELRPPNVTDEAPSVAFGFAASPILEDASAVEFPVTRLPAATYLVRVQVDGAESPLTFDETTRRYELPTVVIP